MKLLRGVGCVTSQVLIRISTRIFSGILPLGIKELIRILRDHHAFDEGLLTPNASVCLVSFTYAVDVALSFCNAYERLHYNKTFYVILTFAESMFFPTVNPFLRR